MNKLKKILLILTGILLIAGLIAGVYLMGKKQEIRKKAAPGLIIKVGPASAPVRPDCFLAPILLVGESVQEIDAADFVLHYNPNEYVFFGNASCTDPSLPQFLNSIDSLKIRSAGEKVINSYDHGLVASYTPINPPTPGTLQKNVLLTQIFFKKFVASPKDPLIKSIEGTKIAFDGVKIYDHANISVDQEQPPTPTLIPTNTPVPCVTEQSVCEDTNGNTVGACCQNLHCEAITFDGTKRCVECNHNDNQCPDDKKCSAGFKCVGVDCPITPPTCKRWVVKDHQCKTEDLINGTSCETDTGVSGTCQAGQCLPPRPTPTPTSTPTPVPPTPTSVPVINTQLLVKFQGIESNKGELNTKVIIKEGAKILKDANLAFVYAENGIYKSPLLTGIPTGDYDIYIKGFAHLTEKWARNINGPIIDLADNILLTGDANNDNAVGLLDYNVLLPAFDNANASDKRADFNKDREVGLLDYNFIYRNFDKLGKE